MPRLGGVAIVIGLALGGGVVAVSLWGRLGTGVGRGELLALALGTRSSSWSASSTT